MRNGQNNKRMRGRSRKSHNPLTRVYELNGPDVKIRGTPSHIAEKYVQLARDAQTSGDPVAAENYNQHAEHYLRLIAVAQDQFRQNTPYLRPEGGGADLRDDLGDDGDEDTGGAGATDEQAPFGTRDPQPYLPRDAQFFPPRDQPQYGGGRPQQQQHHQPQHHQPQHHQPRTTSRSTTSRSSVTTTVMSSGCPLSSPAEPAALRAGHRLERRATDRTATTPSKAIAFHCTGGAGGTADRAIRVSPAAATP